MPTAVPDASLIRHHTIMPETPADIPDDEVEPYIDPSLFKHHSIVELPPPSRAQIEKRRQTLAQGRGILYDALNAGIHGTVREMTARLPLALKAFGQTDAIAYLRYEDEAIREAYKQQVGIMTPEEEKRLGVSPWRRHLLDAVAQGVPMVADVAAIGLLGLPIATTIGLLSANDAWDNSADLPLDDRFWYSMETGLNDAVTTKLFNVIGFGGLERPFVRGSLTKAIQAYRGGAKQAMRSLAEQGITIGANIFAENVEEELAYTIQHGIERSFGRRDPSKPFFSEEFWDGARQTMASATVGLAMGETMRVALNQFSMDPSRRNLDAMGQVGAAAEGMGLKLSEKRQREILQKVVDGAIDQADHAKRAADLVPEPLADQVDSGPPTTSETPMVPRDAGAAEKLDTASAQRRVEEPPARPDLAQPFRREPGESQEEFDLRRTLLDEVDRQRIDNGWVTEKHDADVFARARETLSADYEGTFNRLQAIGESGQAIATAEDKAAYNLLMDEESKRVFRAEPGDELAAAIKRFNRFASAFRGTNAEQGRVFRLSHDPSMSVNERTAEWIRKQIMEGPELLQTETARLLTALKTAQQQGNMDKVASLKEELKRNQAKIEKSITDLIDYLKKRGWDPSKIAEYIDDDIRNGFAIVRDISMATATPWERTYEYYRNAVLSGISLTFVDIPTNITNAGYQVLVQRAGQALITDIDRLIRGRPAADQNAMRANFSEFIEVIRGIGPAWNNAWRRSFEASGKDMHILQYLVDPLNVKSRFTAGQPKIGGVPGKLIRKIGYRRLMWCDELVQNFVGYMEVGAQAQRLWRVKLNQVTDAIGKVDAVQIGKRLKAENPNWSKEKIAAEAQREAKGKYWEYRASAEQQIGRLGDFVKLQTQNMTSDSWKAAMDVARLATFQEPGEVAAQVVKRLGRRLKRAPFGIGPFSAFTVAMFTETPTNIMAQGLRRSPFVGAAILMTDWYQARRSGDYRKVNEQTVNTIIGFGLQGLIMGIIAAANPDDETSWPIVTGTNTARWNVGNRRVPEMAVRIRGTQQYWSLARFGPFATAFGLAVDLGEALMYGGPEEFAVALAKMPLTVARVAMESTYLENLADVLRPIIDNWDRPQMTEREEISFFHTLGRMAGRFGSNWVPAGLKDILRVGVAKPERRVWGEAKDILFGELVRAAQGTEILQRFGYLVDQMKYDYFGFRITRGPYTQWPQTNYWFRLLSPAWAQEYQPYWGFDMMQNWNEQNPNNKKYPETPDKQITVQGKRHWLTNEQAERYERDAGRLLRERMDANKHTFNIEHPDENDMERMANFARAVRQQVRAKLADEIRRSKERNRALARGLL